MDRPNQARNLAPDDRHRSSSRFPRFRRLYYLEALKRSHGDAQIFIRGASAVHTCSIHEHSIGQAALQHSDRTASTARSSSDRGRRHLPHESHQASRRSILLEQKHEWPSSCALHDTGNHRAIAIIPSSAACRGNLTSRPGGVVWPSRSYTTNGARSLGPILIGYLRTDREVASLWPPLADSAVLMGVGVVRQNIDTSGITETSGRRGGASDGNDIGRLRDAWVIALAKNIICAMRDCIFSISRRPISLPSGKRPLFRHFVS